jgi:hypothetical protein
LRFFEIFRGRLGQGKSKKIERTQKFTRIRGLVTVVLQFWGGFYPRPGLLLPGGDGCIFFIVVAAGLHHHLQTSDMPDSTKHLTSKHVVDYSSRNIQYFLKIPYNILLLKRFPVEWRHQIFETRKIE